MGDLSAWRKLATDLDLEFKEGLRAFLESPTLERLAVTEFKAKDMNQVREMLGNPLVQGLLARVFLGAATGVYRNFEFVLYRATKTSSSSSGNRSSHYVHVNLLFREGQRSGLEIYGAGLLARLGKWLRPGRYLRVPNNPELDRLVACRAQEEARTKVLLSDRDLQGRLMRMFTFAPSFRITDEGVRFKEPGRIIDASRARTVMDLIADVAERMGR